MGVSDYLLKFLAKRREFHYWGSKT